MVLDGRGATSFWQPGREQKKQTVEWQRGSLFAPPLNCCYQHFNLDGQRPARLFSVTNAPMVINLFRNTDFVFEGTALFTDRYNGEEDYWVDHGEQETAADAHHWRTNFVPDLRTFRMGEYRDRSFRGYDNRSMSFRLSNNSMASSNALFGVGTYKKGHKHGPGAHLFILRGTGYSLLWFKGEERARVNWRDGTLVSPQDGEYHQHFNTGAEPAMYFKFRLDQLRIAPSAHGFGGDTKPEQIEYEDEDPDIYELFERECAANGLTDLMPRPRYRDG
jgi:gentisate 1,2-dioxygenase